MKPKLDWELSGRYVSLILKGSRDWLEFGFGLHLNFTVRRCLLREDNSRCGSYSIQVRLLWFRAALYLSL